MFFQIRKPRLTENSMTITHSIGLRPAANIMLNASMIWLPRVKLPNLGFIGSTPEPAVAGRLDDPEQFIVVVVFEEAVDADQYLDLCLDERFGDVVTRYFALDKMLEMAAYRALMLARERCKCGISLWVEISACLF